MVPVSAEFIQICQAQIEVLSSGLGAKFCAVYLADNLPAVEAGNLVPVLVYPEGFMSWAESDLLTWLDPSSRENSTSWSRYGSPIPPGVGDSSNNIVTEAKVQGDKGTVCPEDVKNAEINYADASPSLGSSHSGTSDLGSSDMVPSDVEKPQDKSSVSGEEKALTRISADHSHKSVDDNNAIAPLASEFSGLEQEHYQVALPLIYEGLVLGLLVAARTDRSWEDHEHFQIDQIAKTISIACVVDQRTQWLKDRLHNEPYKQFQAHQHEVFDDLIHQFRNPLTALRTFGKLLLRRLQPSDRNFGVAESIVRESDRLQKMLQQFKTALDQEIPELEGWEEDSTPRLLQDAPTDEPRTVNTYSSPPTISSESSKSLAHEGFHQSDKSIIDVSPSTTYLVGNEIEVAPCSLQDVLAPVLDSAWAIAQDHEIELQVELSPNLPLVLADLYGLQEALCNFIDNAIKYTPHGGIVLVRALNQLTEQQAVIIADTGLGIPEADQHHLFERNFRGVQADGTIPGTGLGLAIAHDLLTQMGGTVEIISPLTKATLLADWIPLKMTHPGTAVIVWLQKT